MRTDLKNISFEELEALICGLGMVVSRAREIFQWMYQKQVADIREMTNLSKALRDKLSKIARVSTLAPVQTVHSRDGSRKFVFETADGHGIESVLIPEKSHDTLCISTQVGCALRCRFCYTGRDGLVRNLTAAEILNQVGAVLAAQPPSGKLPNLVFMGMGEPLANYEQTVQSIRVLLNPWGFNFSHRRITVSTAGIVPQIERLGRELPINLAISLNAGNDDARNFLMPINKTFPLRALLAAAQQYPLSSRKRISFEYILVRGVNDSVADAQQLGHLLKNIPCKINLIPFNEHPAVALKAPDEESVQAFQSVLHELNFTAPVRRSKGGDIGAACGQLGVGSADLGTETQGTDFTAGLQDPRGSSQNG